jgi:hypothetical protein
LEENRARQKPNKETTMSSENKEPNTMSSAEAAEPQPGADQPKNPYGGKPGSGLQFPEYYRPTPSVRSRLNYFPGSDTNLHSKRPF